MDVGSAVPYFSSHGAVHTQHDASPSIAAEILSNLEKGMHPLEAIQSSIASDLTREKRQLICLNLNGVGAAYSGSECRGSYHQIIGPNYVIAGNTLSTEQVIEAMSEAFAISEKKANAVTITFCTVSG